jgi:iron complex transport system permease protein
MNTERLVLSGVIVTTFLSSIIVLLTTLLDATKLRSFTFWLLGDLSQATKNSFYLAIIAAVLGTILLTATARSLNLMMLGERDAFDFGVDVGRTRLIVFATASALVGIAVASSGSVGYVGLVVPHIVRLLIGSDNRRVIPATAFAGAIFVVLADTIARTAIAPRELPVGAITALIGAPMFIYLLRKN